MTDNIFLKIINKEIPAEIIYEDDIAIAFNDISPEAPTHILVIPKKDIKKLSDTSEDDQDLLGHLLLVVKKITSKFEIKDFRVVINNGSEAGQTVFHLHLHILAGRNFGWPPG
ncbi:MAG: histidine triad nucleotide-binding protein [Gammaproteobacteria bacterium]|jgi:histidine triad (HIT) family protein|nr:histidine triad nucleotide-binding protein [Gammaproteobacteria bacterium]MBT4462441.1 histidine triad nucleotide-binding protein [Gammaproteobacteria bacterium]MBT4655043.1 histidine triad nucleotide-binding protein [Gammaproteobacteria bacterium]MBT5116688.1 histidine triad nucleotide-binding protein [Gammaproteobacteria bacterium]MBT5762183.1 histidine triad nucleotide-binding protein [Gammaproteobacteria bacterium]